MPLSDADLATLRRRTSATEAEIPNAALDAIYDSTTLGNSNLNRTTFYVLEELAGVLAPLIDKSSEVDSLVLSASQRFDHIMNNLLPYWASRAGIGMAGFAITQSSTFTYRADSLQAEEPTYERTSTTLGWED